MEEREQTENDLVALLYGELGEPQAGALRERLAVEPELKRTFDRLSAASAWANELAQVEAPAGPRLATLQAARERIASNGASGRTSRSRRLNKLWPLAAVLPAAAALVVALLPTHEPGLHGVRSEEDVAARIEPDPASEPGLEERSGGEQAADLAQPLPSAPQQPQKAAQEQELTEKAPALGDLTTKTRDAKGKKATSGAPAQARPRSSRRRKSRRQPAKPTGYTSRRLKGNFSVKDLGAPSKEAARGGSADLYGEGAQQSRERAQQGETRKRAPSGPTDTAANAEEAAPQPFPATRKSQARTASRDDEDGQAEADSAYGAAEGVYQSGRWSAAATGFRAFLSRFPRDRRVPGATLRIAQAYQQLGRKAEATKWFERARRYRSTRTAAERGLKTAK